MKKREYLERPRRHAREEGIHSLFKERGGFVMSRFIGATLGGLALVLAIMIPQASALAGEVTSLRGGFDLTKEGEPPEAFRLDIPEQIFERGWETQPPLVPHPVTRYRINLKSNTCLFCHGKKTYEKAKSPSVPESHFKDRNGKELESTAKSRYFCTQCHVPQVDVKPLVDNTFQGGE